MAFIISQGGNKLMAWGAGAIEQMQQTVPGFYCDIDVSLSEQPRAVRGYVAVPVELNWGGDGEVIRVTLDDYQRRTKEIFGYSYGSPELKYIDEVFRGGAVEVYLYRLNSGVKATSDIGTARYSGTLGNEIQVVIEENPDYVDPEDD